MSKLFVYGSLKRGFSAHAFLQRHNAVFLGEFATHPRYHIHKVNWFPGMVINERMLGGVQGELYEVTEECLASLDGYEGVPYLFDRGIVELEDGSQAIAYFYQQSFAGCPRFEDGVWCDS